MKVKNEAIRTIQNDFPEMVLIFEIGDSLEYVVAKVGSAHIHSHFAVNKQVARKYKLYYSALQDDYFFRKNGQKYFLNDSQPTLAGMGW
jgi:hypothetical protein